MNERQSDFVIDQDYGSVSSDLYDVLFVHSLLQHGRSPGASATDSRTRNTPTNIRSQWHRFLDGLCFLCDAQGGGKGVVAIGVEQRSCRYIFWITTNSSCQTDVSIHLKVVLSILEKSVNPGSVAALLATEIVRCSVGRSTQRVHNYVRRLSNTIPGPTSGAWTEYNTNGTAKEKSRIRHEENRPS